MRDESAGRHTEMREMKEGEQRFLHRMSPPCGLPPSATDVGFRNAVGGRVLMERPPLLGGFA